MAARPLADHGGVGDAGAGGRLMAARRRLIAEASARRRPMVAA
jgi:hypothetical protein